MTTIALSIAEAFAASAPTLHEALKLAEADLAGAAEPLAPQSEAMIEPLVNRPIPSRTASV